MKLNSESVYIIIQSNRIGGDNFCYNFRTKDVSIQLEPYADYSSICFILINSTLNWRAVCMRRTTIFVNYYAAQLTHNNASHSPHISAIIIRG